jgi:acetyl-CoA carboxylase biotin carboxyl carrier protein
MQIKEIADLIQIIEESSVEEFELERSGVKIRIRKGAKPVPSQPVAVESVESSKAETVSVAPEQPSDASKKEESNIAIFKAPIVGTFYEAPKPDAEPFAKVGTLVSKGAVVCIIEAMKIFNQIEADFDGEIVRILVENGQPVEFGEPLFEIRSAS